MIRACARGLVRCERVLNAIRDARSPDRSGGLRVRPTHALAALSLPLFSDGMSG
jgi:hypothetical protein